MAAITKARLQNELIHITREIGNEKGKEKPDNEWLWKLYGKEELIFALMRELDEQEGQ